MPDQDQNKPELSLDERIEELVSEMDEATEKLNKQIEEAALSDEEFNLQAEIGSGITPEEAAALRALEDASAQTDAPEAADEPEPVEAADSAPEEAEAAEPEPSPEPEPAAETETESEPEPEPVSETETPEPTEAEATEPAPEAVEPAPERTLDDQIDDMLEDAVQAPAEPENKPASAVDAVDAELAGLAEEMLDGDFDDAEDIIEQGVESAAPQPAAEEPEETAETAETNEQSEAEAEALDPDDLLDGDFDDAEDVIEQGIEEEVKASPAEPETAEAAAETEPEAAAESEAEPEPQADAEAAIPEAAETPAEPEPQPASADEQEPAPEGKPAKQKKTKKPKQKRIVEPKADSKVPAFAAVAAAHAESIAFSLAEKINKPLDSKPDYMKDIAGWLAAVTLFNALAAWFFLLFLRSPAVGTSSEPTVELVGGAPAAQIEPEPIE